ncbi:hypothetical protein [Leptospira sp. GIMC2001]|uniref:hypothetical protein n=1 Tax=Leptospira sp. GIMC2001 TaxID=1513297 RepID=UPI002349EC5D|nr:hypothetical protein [Leptospira sp. GIMC2001]WCL51029.1 hypothetical protein O4O04_09515 [Leptospira sp. GIMC2001]
MKYILIILLLSFKIYGQENDIPTKSSENIKTTERRLEELNRNILIINEEILKLKYTEHELKLTKSGSGQS